MGIASGAAIAVPSIRRRALVADASGLVARRNGYELHARWEDLLGFERARFAGLVRVTMLRFKDAAVIVIGGDSMDPRRLAKIRKAGADRGIQLSVYVRHPETGRFGDLLREHRPDLATSP
jgi:hypothetical protein